ncbi:MAG: S-adenosylmethionine:tRNA ribosyltransferase-isomerase, partial [Chlamydiia bacterium]|nr:S-adenosylmethionine:tRNA ribosyltransferase-isomerase [Chlamydiia bacterium]
THPQDKRLISVGTTCCRAIEFAADPSGTIRPGSYDASLFIYPGYQFKACRSLLTNFHFPKSTLLMLVSAFAGYDLIREAYARAIASRFRFYSYGDAMLIL